MRSKYLKGFLTGSLLGIAAGMILMPQMSGELRKKVIDEGRNLMGATSKIMDMDTDNN